MLSFRTILSARMLAFLLLTTLLISVEVIVMRTPAFSKHPAGLSLAVLFDLVFGTTALFYWLVARPLRLPFNRLVLVALLMLRVALFILPESSLLPNQRWPLLLIFVEGTVLIIAGLRIRTLVQRYRSLRPTTDAETALRGSLATIFDKRITEIILDEGFMLYYVLLGWRLQPDVPIDANLLTTHRQSGQIALLIGLVVVGLIEGVGVHLLLIRWNPTAAFWVTGLSAYGLLFFVADAIATVKRPSYLTKNQLHIRLGIRWRATVCRSVIATISLINEKPAKQAGRLNGSFLTAPNVMLTFHEPICFTGPYGLKKQVLEFSFFVDERANFVQAIDQSS